MARRLLGLPCKYPWEYSWTMIRGTRCTAPVAAAAGVAAAEMTAAGLAAAAAEVAAAGAAAEAAAAQLE